MTLRFVLFSVFYLAVFGVDQSASVNSVKHTLRVNTTAEVNVPIEKIWNGLSNGRKRQLCF